MFDLFAHRQGNKFEAGKHSRQTVFFSLNKLQRSRINLMRIKDLGLAASRPNEEEVSVYLYME